MIWVKYDVMAPSIAMMSTVDSLKKMMSSCSFFCELLCSGILEGCFCGSNLQG